MIRSLYDFLCPEEKKGYQHKSTEDVPWYILVGTTWAAFCLIVWLYAFLAYEEPKPVTFSGKLIPSISVEPIKAEYDGFVYNHLARKGRIVKEDDLLMEIKSRESGRIRKVKAKYAGVIYDSIASAFGRGFHEKDPLVWIIPEKQQLLIQVFAPQEDMENVRKEMELKFSIDDGVLHSGNVLLKKEGGFLVKPTDAILCQKGTLPGKEVTVVIEPGEDTSLAYSIVKPFFMVKDWANTNVLPKI